jgi:hypothetical protein
MAKQIGGEKMRELGALLTQKLDGLGFCLITFPFHEEHGMANYISNGSRYDMIKFLYETLETLLEDKDFMTPNEN